MRLTALSLALLAFAACERAKTPEPEAPAPTVEAKDVKEVAAADGYGEPGDTVNAIAFWSHPRLNFESRVIAATGDGLKAYKIETGELVSSAGEASTDVAVIYDDAAPAQGYAIAAAANGYSFFAIDNATGALAPVAVETGAPASTRFCAGRSAGGGAALYEVSANAVAKREIGFGESGVTLGDPAPFSASGGASCRVDDRSGDVITVAEDGAIRRLDAESGEASGVALAPKGGAFALVLKEAGGKIALLDPAAAIVSVYDAGDGRKLGAFKVKSTFDLEAVANPSAIAAGYGNYGAVYRDGALALVAAEGPPIRLVPWNGVASALGLDLGAPLDPRTPQAVAAEQDFLDIELKKP